jgi:hypothetical protein
MSDYCDCCSTNVGHIRQHYDPDGLTEADDSPEETLAIFRGCGEDCPLDLVDVEDYLDELAERDAAEAAEEREIESMMETEEFKAVIDTCRQTEY